MSTSLTNQETSFSSSNGVPENDEEWLVYKAKSCVKSDPYAAKAWLLTARTLFPRSFTIQFEAYNMERENNNIKEVSKLIEEMLTSFPQEPQLWQELQSLTSSLQSEGTDLKTTFDKEVFEGLPSTLQCQILLRVADQISDILQQCRLMLLVLDRYPKQVQDHGVKLVDSLLSTEKHSQQSSPVNCYRKYFVCDLLPVVLKCELPQLSPKHFYRWLQKSIEFYIAYLTQPPPQDSKLPTSPELKSPTSKIYSAGRAVVPGLSEWESYIDQPWSRLYSLLQQLSAHLNWDVEDLAPTVGCNRQWQWLQSLWETTSQQGDSAPVAKQVIYCGTFLFFRCLHGYSTHADPELAGAGSVDALVLVEMFKTESALVEPKSKKIKKEPSPPKIYNNKNLEGSSEIIDNFITAYRCWHLMHSNDTLEKEFTKLLQHWKAEQWQWVKRFEADVLVYEGCHKEAITKLSSLSLLSKNTLQKLRLDLQTITCNFCLGNYHAACVTALQVCKQLSISTVKSQQLQMNSSSPRQLQLLQCSASETLPYCIHLFISCFKERAFYTSHPEDHLLGHILVLIQFDWSRYHTLFCEVISKIRRQGSFNYNLFFGYIINIDILEEFAYLKSQDGGKLTLDIMPTSQKAITQTRTVTRGVNKGVKEDFRAMLEKQVVQSEQDSTAIIASFLKDEADQLLQNLQ